MKICVLIKQVPDKNSSLTIAEDYRSLEETNITWVSNESDNYALEEALLLKEAHGGEVITCTLGRKSAGQILKDAMAKGADRSIFLSDSQFENLDILSLAKVFATALRDEKFDLILSGLQSDDQGNSQLGLLLAELLGMSHASLVMGTEVVDNNTIKVKRELEGGWFQWTKFMDITRSNNCSGLRFKTESFSSSKARRDYDSSLCTHCDEQGIWTRKNFIPRCSSQHRSYSVNFIWNGYRFYGSGGTNC